jgi:hypothetical protein
MVNCYVPEDILEDLGHFKGPDQAKALFFAKIADSTCSELRFLHKSLLEVLHNARRQSGFQSLKIFVPTLSIEVPSDDRAFKGLFAPFQKLSFRHVGGEIEFCSLDLWTLACGNSPTSLQ